MNCQKQDWPQHKKACQKKSNTKGEKQKSNAVTFETLATQIEESKGSLSRDKFETIKMLGEGNFTEVFQVMYQDN